MTFPRKLVLLRERSDRKGPRAPEAKLGKRNSGAEEKFGMCNSGIINSQYKNGLIRECYRTLTQYVYWTSFLYLKERRFHFRLCVF